MCSASPLLLQLLLHNPAEFPDFYGGKFPYFFVGRNRRVSVIVKPAMMTTSDDLRGYEPSRRRCYYPTERKLRYFQVKPSA